MRSASATEKSAVSADTEIFNLTFELKRVTVSVREEFQCFWGLIWFSRRPKKCAARRINHDCTWLGPP